MFSDIENARKMMELLGDDGFVNALTNAQKLVEDVDETLDRVEKIEGDAAEAVREANVALNAVDNRLERVDETISLLEAKIEGGFSAAFFFFAWTSFAAGDLFLAAGLLFMGLLGVSSLAITIVKMPQVQKLLKFGRYAADRLDSEEKDEDESSP